MLYVILPSVDTPHSEGVSVRAEDLIDTVEDLAGRNCRPWLNGNLRRTGRCYVATAAYSPGRLVYGRGFHVRRVDS